MTLLVDELLRSTEWDRMAGNTPVSTLQHPYTILSAELIDEEVNGKGELLDSFRNGDMKGVLDGLGDTLKVTAQMCYALGVSPVELLKEVNDSNFSKFCDSEQEAIDTVEWYKENDTRYRDVHYVQRYGVGSNNEPYTKWIILGYPIGSLSTTPKVLKNKNYKELDLSRWESLIERSDNES